MKSQTTKDFRFRICYLEKVDPSYVRTIPAQYECSETTDSSKIFASVHTIHAFFKRNLDQAIHSTKSFLISHEILSILVLKVS